MVNVATCVECVCGYWFPINSRCDYCKRTYEDVKKAEEDGFVG